MSSTEDNDIITDWTGFNLNNNILRGIYAYGFEKPSPIQQKSIKPILDGKDIIAQAQSGTGKTACFTIGALSKVNTDEKNLQVIVLSPTRELSIQTGNVIKNIANFIPKLKIDSCYDSNKKENAFTYSVPHIICGCPGRVIEIITKYKINTDNLKFVVLDEADEMLSIGFKDQIMSIFNQLVPKHSQVALFSATLPKEALTISESILHEPEKIIMKTEQLTLEGIQQFFVAVNDDISKYETLKDLYKYLSISQCIIYCNSVKRVKDLHSAMSEDNFPVTCIHSSMNKYERNVAFNNFRKGDSRVLISSNVTSRGIDVQQVSVVINFDVSRDIHNYLHRIGRSGRWGRKGVGINLVTKKDVNTLRDIENYYQCQINPLPSDMSFFQNI